MNPVIEVRNLTRSYSDGESALVACNGVDLSVKSGEILCIMGASGSGKSTLLRLLGGLDVPTEGEVMALGESLSSLTVESRASFRRDNVGFIFQNYRLLPRFSVLENVGFKCIIRGTPAKFWKPNALELLKRVGLEGVEGRRSDRLSGGQQQRVGIARALMGEPRIILADEPTGNLDTANSLEIMRLITRLVASRPAGCCVFVTHDEQIASFADRVVEMRDGRLVND